MKVESKKIQNFLRASTINDNVEGCILHFTNEGLKVNVRSTDNISVAVGLMNKECFQNYEIVDYPIKSVSKFSKLLDLFNGIIELKKQDNLLVLTGNVDEKHSRKVSYVLASEEFIENEFAGKLPSEFDQGFDLQKNIFIALLKSVTAVKASRVIFEVKNNILNLTVGDDNFDSITESINVEYKDAKTKLGSTFEKIVPIVTDKTNIAFNDNYPVQFLLKCEDYMVRIIVAPLVDDEDEEVKKEEKPKKNEQPVEETNK